MRALLLVVLLVGCKDDPYADVKQMDVTTFRAMLQCAARTPAVGSCEELRNEAFLIEKVRAEPDGKGAARYLVWFKNTARPKAVFGEFPGKITDEMVAAGISYSVKPR